MTAADPAGIAEIREAIRDSKGSIRAVAARLGVNPKTVAKWRTRATLADRRRGPHTGRSSVLTAGEEAAALLFRMHSRLPLDDCHAALAEALPRLSRSALHRCYARHGISRLAREPAMATIGHLRIDAVTLPFAGGARHLLVAADRGSRMMFAELHAEAGGAAGFLAALVATFSEPIQSVTMAPSLPGRAALAELCAANGIALQLAESPWSDAQRAAVGETLERALGSEPADLAERLLQFLTRFNLSCPLGVLGGRVPYDEVRRLRPKVSAAPRRRRRSKGAQDTRTAILRAARGRLAHDGPEGLSLSEVARIAGVNRGTAYQHFETRDKLIKATTDWVSDQLHRAIFGEIDAEDLPVEQVDVATVSDRLAHFAMENPELCRGWLMHLLSSEDPADDRFWRAYQGAAERFARSPNAQPGIDPEVLSVIMLAGAFLWPVWASAKGKGQGGQAFAERYAQESLRLSLYGTLRREAYPAIAARVARGGRR